MTKFYISEKEYHVKGKKGGYASRRYTDVQVRAIRLLDDGTVETRKLLAVQYKCTYNTIKSICNFKSYADVK